MEGLLAKGLHRLVLRGFYNLVGFYIFLVFWVKRQKCLSLQTRLLCIVVELAEGGSVALADDVAVTVAGVLAGQV